MGQLMIQPEVREVSTIFRGELHWMFGQYPALIPLPGWPSVGILDALCRGMRGRDDWTVSEKAFVAGAAAHLGELTHDCWERFAEDVRVELDDGVVCTARGADGSTYRLPLERALTATLKDPDTLLRQNLTSRAPVGLPLRLNEGDHLLEMFGLSACLGISPLGEGDWAELRIDGLADHIEAVAPFLARTCAEHYGRLHPREPLGQKADLYQRLIWPLTLCDSYVACKEAAANTLAFLDGALKVMGGARPLLTNLARFPSAVVRGAALTCLALDERVAVADELAEVAASHFGERARDYRTAAIELAAERGRNIDWLNNGANPRARFRFERKLGLIPLVQLPFEQAVKPANRALVEALVEMEVEVAARILQAQLRRNGRLPELVFQQAVLRRRLGDPEEAEALLAEILHAYPEKLDGQFYLEAGIGALAQDRMDDAIARLEQARALPGRRLQVWTALAKAYAEAGRADEAAELFGEAINLGHLRSDVLLSRAELHQRMGKEEAYSQDLAAAAALHPFNPGVVKRVMDGYVST